MLIFFKFGSYMGRTPPADSIRTEDGDGIFDLVNVKDCCPIEQQMGEGQGKRTRFNCNEVQTGALATQHGW